MSAAVADNADAGSSSKEPKGSTKSSKQEPKKEDTVGNRTTVAEQHGFPWQPGQGEMRYSVQEACLGKKPTPKRLQMEKKLEAILGEKPKKVGSATDMMQKFVFHMLAFDLMPYSKRGSGLAKEGLPKAALQQLCAVHFEYLGSQKPTQKEQKNIKMKTYPDLWEEIKDRTLRECGLSIGHGTRARVALCPGGDLTSPVKDGQWRNAVYCPHPWRQEEEDLEDPRERLAKRARYVAGATQEQSMGRPGYNLLFETLVPLDTDALLCIDKETRSEWDALHPYVSNLNKNACPAELAKSVLPGTHVRTLRSTQGGLSHEEASALVSAPNSTGGSAAADAASGPRMDPTQQSFVDHMSAWRDAYVNSADICQSNLPLPSDKDSAWQLCGPVLLLGTAGTGKTTTMQAANQQLEVHGLKGRIVRAAYTGVAASNMGSGARTIVSLFRLKTSRGAGPLQPLSEEDMQSMATELGDMAVLEFDELSMIEKVVLAHIHLRLQQWRFACYHPHCCDRSSPCRCGARLPFGGVKVVFAGDFGLLPPVAVKDERTLLHGTVQSTGKDTMEVNLGARLFRNISNVFRLRRIHRQAGASQYKESLLRLRDAAHTKEDVALWKSHDMTSPDCTLSAEEIRSFQRDRVHLFCEKQRAGAFNGRRLGEDATAAGGSGILRVWSVESNPLVERYSCNSFGGLRRVLHFTMGAPVMLISNLRTVWNLVNGLRGRIVGVVWEEEDQAADQGFGFSDGPSAAAASWPKQPQKRNAAEVGGVQATSLKYLVIDFPGYVGPCMVEGHPTYVCIGPQQIRHERMPALSRTQFPVVLSYGMTVHKSQGLTLKEGCVFDMEHEPTWQPFRSICGLAFVGLSRVTDFLYIAFRHVPDYWVFRAVADTPLFHWRSSLEMQLDAKHDATSNRHFFGKASLQDEFDRHVLWSETTTGSSMSSENKTDLTQMLSVRGVLPAPGYTDKPQRLPASKLGGGRNKRRTMRGANVVPDSSAAAPPEEDDPMYEDMLTPEQMEQSRRDKEEAAIYAEFLAEEARDPYCDPTFGKTPEEIQMMLDEVDEDERYANMGWWDTSKMHVFFSIRWHSSTWHPLQASVCVFSDRTMAHQHLAFVAGQRVCVFSDRTMAHQHLAFVAGQRVCLFWPHDGTSALGIRCRPACVFSDLTMAHQHLAFVAGQRVCLFWPHDGTSSLGIRCRPACVSFLTARWRISTWHSLQASACVFSDRTMAHQHSWWICPGISKLLPGSSVRKNNRSRKKKNFACLLDLHAVFFADRGSMESQVKESLEMLTGYCILWGGARLQSRGVEGVTGCSGEGLHSRSWSICYYFAATIASDGCLWLWILRSWVCFDSASTDMFCWEAPSWKVVEWRTSPGAAGRGCTLEFEALDTIMLPLLHPMAAY